MEIGFIEYQDKYNLGILHHLLVWHSVMLIVIVRIGELKLNIVYHQVLVTSGVIELTWLIKCQ